MADPASNPPLRGNGPDAWFGWPTIPELETLREEWLETPDLPTQKALAEKIQITALQQVPFIPLGQIFCPTAARANIEGILPSPFPIFWNVRKT